MRYGWLCCLLLFLSACSPVNTVQEFDQQQAAILLQQRGATRPAKQMFMISLPAKTSWQQTNYSPFEDGAFVVLLPAGQNPIHWTESIQGRMLPYDAFPDVTAPRYFQDEIHFVQKHCQQMNYHLLQQTATFVYAQIQASTCDNQKDFWQVSKIVNGQDGVYVLRYISRLPLTKNKEESMSKNILNSILIRR